MNNLTYLYKKEDLQRVVKIMTIVKEIRLLCDYSAVDFALEIGLTNKAYTMLEREGRGTAITLWKVLLKLTEFGIPLHDILHGIDRVEEGAYDGQIEMARNKHQATALTKKQKMEINRQQNMLI